VEDVEDEEDVEEEDVEVRVQGRLVLEVHQFFKFQLMVQSELCKRFDSIKSLLLFSSHSDPSPVLSEIYWQNLQVIIIYLARIKQIVSLVKL
jgi:hypothetical protein